MKNLYGSYTTVGNSTGSSGNWVSKKSVLQIIISGVLTFSCQSLLAGVDDNGLFELDGNAVDGPNDPGGTSDDWVDFLNGGEGGSIATTGIVVDPDGSSIFTGGRKDIQEISQWAHSSGATPDKSDITNAYSAAYSDNGELVIYFGADRVANAGDTFMGFWFFKGVVQAEPDGSFSGEHQDDDTLVLVNFPQANNAQPEIKVVVWDSTCSKADSNSPENGDCAAKNLRLKSGQSGADAICDGTGKNACAISNEENTENAYPGLYSEAPWPYTSKDGVVGHFPYETFFEGGINISSLLGGNACFSSFMAETRSSSSFTASLKDFTLGSFEVCSIDVTKLCTNGRLTDDESGIIYDVSGTVSNNGFGSLYGITVTDTPDFDEGSLTYTADTSELSSNSQLGYSGTVTVPFEQNGFMNTVNVIGQTIQGDENSVLTDLATYTCPTVQLNPAMAVYKNCTTSIELLDNPVVVTARVNVTGQVCNTGDSTLFDIEIYDDKYKNYDEGGIEIPAFSLLSLAAPVDPETQNCANFEFSYLPAEAVDSEGVPTDCPADVVFTDTVTATAETLFGNVLPGPDEADITAMATCSLCLDGACAE